MQSDVLNDLTMCHNIVRHKDRWVQGEFVDDSRDKVAYCSLGVIDAVVPLRRRKPVLDALYLALPTKYQECPDDPDPGVELDWKRDCVSTYNDGKKHRTVMGMWRRAIATQEARSMTELHSAFVNEKELVVAGD